MAGGLRWRAVSSYKDRWWLATNRKLKREGEKLFRRAHGTEKHGGELTMAVKRWKGRFELGGA